MNYLILSKSLITLLITGLVLTIGGCQTVSRENIISSINTGIGISVAENPKTELYEVKVGYIRSQYYSVPTGKIVKNENVTDGVAGSGRQDIRSNRADITPQVVSGIKMNSGIKHLFVGMDVSENFAVGEAAVNSPAAVAMYVAASENAETAAKAAEAAKDVSEAALIAVDIKNKDLITKRKAIENYVAPSGSFDNAKLTEIAKETNVKDKVKTIDSVDKLKDFLNNNLFDIDDLFKKIPKP